MGLMCRGQYCGLAGPPYYMWLPYEPQILVDTVNSCSRSNTRKIVQNGKVTLIISCLRHKASPNNFVAPRSRRNNLGAIWGHVKLCYTRTSLSRFNKSTNIALTESSF